MTCEERSARKTLALLTEYCKEESTSLEELLRPVSVEGKVAFDIFEKIIGDRLDADISDVIDSLRAFLCRDSDQVDLNELLSLTGSEAPDAEMPLTSMPLSEFYHFLADVAPEYTITRLRERLSSVGGNFSARIWREIETQAKPSLTVQEVTRLVYKRPFREKARDQLRREVEELFARKSHKALTLGLDGCVALIIQLGSPASRASLLDQAREFCSNEVRRLSVAEFEKFLIARTLCEQPLSPHALTVAAELGEDVERASDAPYHFQLQERHALLLEQQRQGGGLAGLQRALAVRTGSEDLLRGLAKLALGFGFGLKELFDFFSPSQGRMRRSAALLAESAPAPGELGPAIEIEVSSIELTELPSQINGLTTFRAELYIGLLGASTASNVLCLPLELLSHAPDRMRLAPQGREKVVAGHPPEICLFGEVVLHVPLKEKVLDVSFGGFSLKQPWGLPLSTSLRIGCAPLHDLPENRIRKSSFLCSETSSQVDLRIVAAPTVFNMGLCAEKKSADVLLQLLSDHPVPFTAALNRLIATRLAALPIACRELGTLWSLLGKRKGRAEAAQRIAAELWLFFEHNPHAKSVAEPVAVLRSEMVDRRPLEEAPAYYSSDTPFDTEELLSKIFKM